MYFLHERNAQTNHQWKYSGHGSESKSDLKDYASAANSDYAITRSAKTTPDKEPWGPVWKQIDSGRPV